MPTPQLIKECKSWWGHGPKKTYNWQVFLIWKAQQMALEEPGPFSAWRVRAIAGELNSRKAIWPRVSHQRHSGHQRCH